jgi:DNA-binding transcriptional ArsR family regulator
MPKSNLRTAPYQSTGVSLNVLRALANETRMKVVTYLVDSGELSFSDLVKKTGTDGPTLAPHLRRLRSTGLVVRKNNPDPEASEYRLYAATKLALDAIGRLR